MNLPFYSLFSRHAPWSLLGPQQRVKRMARIAFGCYLVSALAFLIAMLVALLLRSPAPPMSNAQWVLCIAMIPFLLFLAWGAGRIFIWYEVEPPTSASPNGFSPPAPPPEGAPRPAPLLPLSPRTQSAAADLPNEEQNQPRIVVGSFGR